MRNLLSPLCLILGLLLLFGGFASLAMDLPDEGVKIHDARTRGDETYEEALVSQLDKQTWAHRLLTSALFSGGAFLLLVAFATMTGQSGKNG